MTKYFVTSDHHFGHKNIIDLCGRPYSTIEEHDSILIELWNRRVSHRDIVYYLGDFTLGDRVKYIDNILSRLSGTIRLIQGNHDKAWVKKAARYIPKIEWIKSYHEEKFTFNKEEFFIVMSHYPFISWNKSCYGSIHLHGHTHGSLNKANLGLRRYDVGVDSNNYMPSSLEDICFFKQHVTEFVDQHDL